MDTDVRKVLCESCRQFVPVTEIRYLPRGKDSMTAMCAACRGKKTDAPKTPEAPKPVAKPAMKAAMQDDKLGFFCSRCNYKFKFSAKGVTTLKCPYCGKSDKVSERRNTSSSDLLKMSSDA